MFPDLGEDVNQLLKDVASDFHVGNDGVEVVPTFVPASSINSEIEFELEHNLTNRSDQWLCGRLGQQLCSVSATRSVRVLSVALSVPRNMYVQRVRQQS